MLSWYSSQWPDVSHSSLRTRLGVRTSSKPPSRRTSRDHCSSARHRAMPRGCQKGAAGDSGWKVNRSRSRPSLRWSRFLASSSRQR